MSIKDEKVAKNNDKSIAMMILEDLKKENKHLKILLGVSILVNIIVAIF